jgi:CubicO group peptidase (beta-lactamase class C family)
VERLQEDVERDLWPLVEQFVATHAVAGLAMAVLREGAVVARGFGVRDLRTGAPVTPETMFHLASVSKPFVATAIVSLATTQNGQVWGPGLDLDAPITTWVPELTLADGRQDEVTPRGLLSHTSGLPDVSDYGWHDPQLGDDALSELARSLSHWSLQTDPGAGFSYSNAGYELLGLALSRVLGTTFEEAARQRVLVPVGMTRSTFLRSEVPADLACSPHVAMPLTVPDDDYPYTRRHAPSSTLHSNVLELCRWMQANLAAGPLDEVTLDLLSRPVVSVGEPPWDEEQSLGWAVGTYRGHRTLSHSGADPGFGSRLVLVPGRRTGVVVLANSNTVFTSMICSAALDIALGETTGEGLPAMSGLLPPVVRVVADTLATSGEAAAVAEFHRLAAAEPAEHDLDDDDFVSAVWGAIELHRTDLVWPLLRVWTAVRPDSSQAWTMTGWAHQVDGDSDQALTHLHRALELDPDNEDAALILGNLASE